MLHAVLTFHSDTDNTRAFTEMIRLSKSWRIFDKHASFRFYDEYHMMVLAYDNNDGFALEAVTLRNLKCNNIGFDVENPFLVDDFYIKKWLNCELDRDSAERFKEVLRDMNIKYEPSECFNKVYFKVYCDDLERYILNDYLVRY